MLKIIGVILIALGVLGLVYGGFSFTEESHDAKLGPLTFSVKEKERVNIPTWAGVVAIAAGTGTLVFSARRRKT